MITFAAVSPKYRIAELDRSEVKDYTIDGHNHPLGNFLAAGETFTAVVTTSENEVFVADGLTLITKPGGAVTPAAPAIVNSGSAVLLWLYADDDAQLDIDHEVEVSLLTSADRIYNITLVVRVLDK